MKLFFRIAGLFFLLSSTLAQEGFDLADALDDIAPKATVAPPPKKDGGFDLLDAFGDDDPVTKPPVVLKPNSGGDGGGTIKDSDLFDVNAGDYKPDGGRSGGRAVDPGYDTNSGGGGGGGGGGEQTQERADDATAHKAGSGQIAGIVSAIAGALFAAGTTYFAHQKKKLCFKMQGGQDPEMGNHQVTQSEPQVMSNLLKS